jgi:hypothetical protein
MPRGSASLEEYALDPRAAVVELAGAIRGVDHGDDGRERGCRQVTTAAAIC